MKIQLYSKKYKGSKVMFNSRKGSGATIEGVAIQVVPQLNVVILRDAENFAHAVSMLSIQQIN